MSALIQSDILLRPSTSSEAIAKTIGSILNLALKKPWFREPSSKALCLLIRKIPRIPEGKGVAEKIYSEFEHSGLLPSQDGAAIVLTLNLLPKAFKPQMSTSIWKHANPLHSSNLALLTRVLKEIPSEDGVVKDSGNFKPEVHFIWTVILQNYVEGSKEIVGFKTFWDTVVESIKFSLSPINRQMDSLIRRHRLNANSGDFKYFLSFSLTFLHISSPLCSHRILQGV